MAFPELTSKDNPILKTIRRISAGSPKSSQPLLAIEGVRMLEEASLSGCRMEAIVLAEHFGIDSREQFLIDSWRASQIPIYRIKESLFKTLSKVETPQGAIALVHVPPKSLSEFVLKKHPLILCAWGIQDPGNLGTLIRTSMAAGADLVCTIKGTVSIRNPKTIRSSAGALFRMPIAEHIEASEFLSYCRKNKIQIYRTDARDGIEYTKADFMAPCAILLGNEGSGIQEEDLAGFPSIHIPMARETESLNVAVAGAILLFEASRQRRRIKEKPKFMVDRF
jgi:TrmH family RNA methyltransferase